MKDALEIMTGPLADQLGKYQSEKDTLELLSHHGIFMDIASEVTQSEMFQDEVKFRQILGNLFKNALHHRQQQEERQPAE